MRIAPKVSRGLADRTGTNRLRPYNSKHFTIQNSATNATLAPHATQANCNEESNGSTQLLVVLQCEDRFEDLLPCIQALANGASGAVVLLHQELRHNGVSRKRNDTQLFDCNGPLPPSLDVEAKQAKHIRETLRCHGLDARVIFSLGHLTDATEYCIRESGANGLTIVTPTDYWFVNRSTPDNKRRETIR